MSINIIEEFFKCLLFHGSLKKQFTKYRLVHGMYEDTMFYRLCLSKFSKSILRYLFCFYPVEMFMC